MHKKSYWNSQNKKMAETVGFEPTLGVNLNTLSKRAPSTTRPRLLGKAQTSPKDSKIQDFRKALTINAIHCYYKSRSFQGETHAFIDLYHRPAGSGRLRY